MEVLLLGPVALRRAGGEISLRRQHQRCVLAVLAMTPGQAVPSEVLIDRVWGDDPPKSALHSLYAHVSAVRRLLTGAAGGADQVALRRLGGGYALEMDADRIDLHLARRRTGEAHASAGNGAESDARALTLLREAYALWRGSPLAGLKGTWAEQMRVGLDQERLALAIDRFTLELRLGEHAAATGPLAALLVEHPLAEPLVGLHMLALYRCGRQAEALQAYASARQRLVEEIGDEPGEDLRQLHARILRRDPTLNLPPAAVVTSPPGVPLVPGGSPPAQLPPDVVAFTGRVAELQRLDALSTADQRAALVTLVVVDGAAGVGKTALAVHWAHRVREQFPDGQLYADLRGYAADAPLPPLAVLTRFLHALGVHRDLVPVDVAEAAALYRSILADRRVLVLLDDAVTADQVRPLLPSGPGSVVLVTSRHRLSGLVAQQSARPLTLHVLPAAEATLLLDRLLGDRRTDDEPDAVAELATLCGHLPLALRLAAANLTTHNGRAVSSYVRQLRDADRLSRLGLSDDPASTVRAALDLSYSRLAPGPRRMFRLFGLVKGPDLSVEAAANLAGGSGDDVAEQLDLLASTHLLEEHAPGRYACHDLLRLYAAELLEREDPRSDLDAALRRLYDYYLHTSEDAARRGYPQALRLPARRRGHPPVVRAPVDDPGDPLRWLDAERPNLVAAVQDAAGQGWHDLAWGMADNLRGYFWIRRHLCDWDVAASAGLRAAEAAGELSAQATSHLSLSALRSRQGRRQEATEHASTALTLARQSGWRDGQAAALGGLGVIAARHGDAETGIRHLREAVALCEQTGWQLGYLVALTNLGAMLFDAGQLAEALTYCRQARSGNTTLGSATTDTVILNNLGKIWYAMGRLDRARSDLERSGELCRATGNTVALCSSRVILARVRATLGHHECAAELAAASLAHAREWQDQDLQADSLNTLAAIALRQGRHEQAGAWHRQALDGAEAGTDPWPGISARLGLATIDLRRGELAGARAQVTHALTSACRANIPILKGEALATFAQVLLADGELPAARRCSRQAVGLHRRTGCELGEARALLVLGHVHRQLGDREAARRCYRAGRARFTRMGVPVADEAALLEGFDDPAGLPIP